MFLLTYASTLAPQLLNSLRTLRRLSLSYSHTVQVWPRIILYWEHSFCRPFRMMSISLLRTIFCLTQIVPQRKSCSTCQIGKQQLMWLKVIRSSVWTGRNHPRNHVGPTHARSQTGIKVPTKILHGTSRISQTHGNSHLDRNCLNSYSNGAAKPTVKTLQTKRWAMSLPLQSQDCCHPILFIVLREHGIVGNTS